MGSLRLYSRAKLCTSQQVLSKGVAPASVLPQGIWHPQLPLRYLGSQPGLAQVVSYSSFSFHCVTKSSNCDFLQILLL